MAQQRRFQTIRRSLATEVTRYHQELEAREEKQRQQQREARARVSERVSAGVLRFWSRRGDVYQQALKVSFDVAKHQHDKRRQEDLLRETEELTRKLLESLFTDARKNRRNEVPRIQRHCEGTPGLTPTLQGSPAPTASPADTIFVVTPPASSRAEEEESDAEGPPIEESLSLLDTNNGTRPLRHYQRSALRWMIHLYENKLNGILADEMGLGKTVQTIALLCYFAEKRNDWGPHLVVVPTTVVLNWKAEFERWAPGLKVLTYIGSAKERTQLRRGWTSEGAFDVCVTSYNLVVLDRKVFRRRPWGFLVLDEAHHVKNFMSVKWQSLFDLQAEYRLLLTGTPLQNSMMELWSLFHFLLPFASAFRSNDEFKEWFSNPLDEMISGKSSLNEDIVRRLQALIRPFMLRRLKKDVETQLPSKTEKVVLCQLSRRQRSLYDDYMQLADTKNKISGKGGAGGVLSVLLSLRKVCDHPDMFEERPTKSPFALDYNASVRVTVPRVALLFQDHEGNFEGTRRFPSFCVWDMNDDRPAWESSIHHRKLSHADDEEEAELHGPEAFPSISRLIHLDVFTFPYFSSSADRADFVERFHPKYLEMTFQKQQSHRTAGSATADALLNNSLGILHAAYDGILQQAKTQQASRRAATVAAQWERYRAVDVALSMSTPSSLQWELRGSRLARNFPALCPTISTRVTALMPVIQKVCVYVPAVVSTRPPHLHWLLPVSNSQPFTALGLSTYSTLIGAVAKMQDAMACGRSAPRTLYDGSFFLEELWPIHVRRNFSFPEKRLLIHDCGKLQFLEPALKELRQGGHRVLIFTQFVQMLNILERFLALIGVAYMRLDGATRVELRQQLVDRFNSDARITCMILSTRSGGIGLNLTGADTVVFYDSDWNPTMDLQAQDRCHRIGQTRPVTIYRLISEHSVEEAILKKARERKKLNNVVIRGGQFHTIAGVNEQYEDSTAAYAALSDPVNLRSFFHDLDEDASVVSNDVDLLNEMEKVEDEEDRQAGKELERELAQRAAEDAADGGGEDGDTAAVGGKPAALGDGGTHELVTRRLPNTLLDEALALSLRRGVDAASSPAPNVEPRSRGSPLTLSGVSESRDAVELAVRKRQREVIVKGSRTPLDQYLVLQYSRSHPEDAEDRYYDLVNTYEAQMGSEAVRDLPRFRAGSFFGDQ